MRPRTAVRHPRALAAALAALLPGLLGAGCAPSSDARAGERRPGQGGQENAGPKPVLVRTIQVKPGDLTHGIRATATLESHRTASLSVEVSGRVASVHADVGQEVKQGEVLVALEPSRLQLALAEAEHALLEAKDRAKEAAVAAQESQRAYETAIVTRQEATQNLQRQEELSGRKLVTEGELDAAKFGKERAVIAVESAKLALERAEVAGTLAKTAVARAEVARDRAALDAAGATLKAPFAGVISKRQVRAGEQVAPGTMLFELVDPNALFAPVYVPQKNLPLIARVAEVEVSADALPGVVGTAAVERRPTTVDPETGNLRLDVVLKENAGEFLPGMFVTLRLVTARRTQVAVVPKKAVRLEGREAIVYRIDEGGLAREVRFETGLEDSDRVEVTGGALSVGDRIVLVGIDQLSDGVKVREAATSAEPARDAGD